MSSLSWIFNANWIVVAATIFLTLLYHFVLKQWNFFSNRRVKFNRGKVFFGAMWETIVGQESIAHTVKRLYNEFPNEQVTGAYETVQPMYIIRDPEVIKKITIQHFDHFLNHQPGVGESSKLLGRSLLLRKDQAWKNMRSTLSPAFTGNKMRAMFALIRDCTIEYCDVVKKAAEKDNIFELKDLFSRFAADIIAEFAFGVKVDSMTDKENEFYLTGKKMSNLSGIVGLKMFLYDVIPSIMKKLGIQWLGQRTEDFLRQMAMSTISYRRKNNIQRPDVIQLLIQAKAGTLEADNSQDGDASSKIGQKINGEHQHIEQLFMRGLTQCIP